MAKGIGLISGGLDSMLAIRVLQDQGIDILGISFVTPFFSSTKAEIAAKRLDIELRAIDITDIHMKVVRNPKHGYGANMNPCIDCHALMVKYAGDMMKEAGADFIFTGEVLGERPMSQNRASLLTVARESGYGEYLLRPMSALLLDETKPEREGVVDRSKLLSINGRSRRPQIALAKHYGITDYPTPASGCRLTEPGFSRRLKDLLRYEEDVSRAAIEILRQGRHLRLSEKAKLILGRNEAENEKLLELRQEDDVTIDMRDHPGPTGVLQGSEADKWIEYAASLCAHYSHVPKKMVTEAIIVRHGKESVISVAPPDSEDFKKCIL